MTYFTTITKKGQITIPKPIREALDLKVTDRILVEMPKKDKVIIVKPLQDFLQIAKEIKVRKKIDPLKTRELMEKTYERE